MESEFNTYLIPNEMCRRAGISGRFMSAIDIGVFPSQAVKPTSSDQPSPYTSNTEAKIYQFRPEVILFHPIIRRLVNEACGIFLSIQRKTSCSQAEILFYSIQYRSVIRACLEDLQEKVGRVMGTERDDILNYITIFYSIECVWHLCEVLYIKENVGNMVGMKLLDWVRFHIPKHERAAAHMMTNYDGSGMNTRPDYWPTTIGCMLHGRVAKVRALLRMHAHAGMQHFRAADASLRAMPTYAAIADGMPVGEFLLMRKHWLIDTQTKIDGKVFHAEPMVSLIMRLVVGEELAWNEIQSHCETWYELLAAWLFYTDPTLRCYDLHLFARKCARRMRTSLRHIDAILLAAMEMDFQFLRQIQTMNENGWFITHFVDLMYHAQMLDAWKTSETQSTELRESLLLEYGTLLMGHFSLWQVGLSYLDNCPIHGAAAIELLLPRTARTEAKTRKAIREATKRRLPALVQSLAKIQCLQYIRMNRLGNALIWALKANNPECTSHLVNCMLTQYRATYILPHEDLLTNFGISMLANDSLVFLGKYYDFRHCYSNKKYSDAAQILVSLIGSKFTPRFFWDVLFTDTLNLLECEDYTIDANASLVIVNYLEERANESLLKGKLQMIRMALARNVANIIT